MTTALPADLRKDLETAGYFPQAASRSIERSLRGAAVLTHLVRAETTFDGPEVRRHLTVVVLTGLDTKGLEFDGIVVVRPQEIEDESATGRATLYVVLTRATQLLTTVS